MKQNILVFLFFVCANFLFAQNDMPKEITKEILQKINTDVEKLIPAFKKSLKEKNLSNDAIEFAVDTFKIENVTAKKMDINYSTAGMNHAVNDATDAYDKLMNKYYNKLLKLLQPEDKKILLAAQKAWLGYRNAENNLIDAMTKKEYSGGGTIQSNIATGAYSDLIKQRTISIFNYYNNVIK
jgi:uncharacterized protein YecT (DUF1311 family)